MTVWVTGISNRKSVQRSYLAGESSLSGGGALLRDYGRVVPRRAGRRRQVFGGRQHDLVDPQTIFADLNAHALDTRRGEIDRRAEYTRAVPIVLPAPAADR